MRRIALPGPKITVTKTGRKMVDGALYMGFNERRMPPYLILVDRGLGSKAFVSYSDGQPLFIDTGLPTLNIITYEPYDGPYLRSPNGSVWRVFSFDYALAAELVVGNEYNSPPAFLRNDFDHLNDRVIGVTDDGTLIYNFVDLTGSGILA